MYIDLKWENINTGQVTTNIYRGTSELDRANLGTPLVSFTNKTVTYRDNTVVAGGVYYYVIEFVSGAERASTRNFQVTAIFTRGHGNPTVVIGNDDYGVMDVLNVLRTYQVMTQLGMPTAGFSDQVLTNTYKFSYKNKVYIVAGTGINQMMTTYSAVAQLFNNATGTLITVDGFNYRVMLPPVLPDGWDGTTVITGTQPAGDMYSKLVASLSSSAVPGPLESLGKLNTLNTAYVLGREVVNGQVALRAPSGNTVSWTPSTGNISSSVVLFLLFELVES